MNTHRIAYAITALALAWLQPAAAQEPSAVRQAAFLPLPTNEPGLPGFSSPAAPPPVKLMAALTNPAPVPGPSPEGSGSLKGLPELPIDGYWIQDAPLNDVIQYLARSAGMQYFHNNLLKTPEYQVTGHLLLKDPRKQLQELVKAYGLTMVAEGSTIYVYTPDQSNRIPMEQAVYQLKYLRKTGFGKSPLKEAMGTATAGGGGGGGAGGGGGGGSQNSGEGSKGGVNDTDPFEKDLRDLISPLLSIRGNMIYQKKTNCVIILDTQEVIKKALTLLEAVDKPRRQIAINVRVLTVKNLMSSKVGVDWSSILGDGVSLQVTKNLNSLFNLPDTFTKATQVVSSNSGIITVGKNSTSTTGGGAVASGSGGSTSATPGTTSTSSSIFTNSPSSSNTVNQGYTNSLTFTPLQLTGVLHALHAGNIAKEDTGPTLVTEDNEPALISIIDRYPIITQQLNGVGNNASQISDTVRYKVDTEDPNPSSNPDMTREIGVTLSVTPTLLPDGTLRLNLRPRVASITNFITASDGNQYPEVSESTVEAISRVPNGHSLMLGGFYNFNDSHADNEVPILGKIPIIKNLFSYHDKEKNQLSLIFIVTPYAYDASSTQSIERINRAVPEPLPNDWNNPDKGLPGPPVKQEIGNSLNRMFFGDRPGDNNNGPDNPLLPPLSGSQPANNLPKTPFGQN